MAAATGNDPRTHTALDDGEAADDGLYFCVCVLGEGVWIDIAECGGVMRDDKGVKARYSYWNGGGVAEHRDKLH